MASEARYGLNPTQTMAIGARHLTHDVGHMRHFVPPATMDAKFDWLHVSYEGLSDV